MPKQAPPPPFDDLMLTCAFRYCLTRHTYVTGAAVDWVHQYWPTLSSRCRVVLRRDLAEHVRKWKDRDMAWASSAIDMRGWIALLAWMDERLTPEERSAL